MILSRAQWLATETIEAIAQDLRICINPDLFEPVEPPEGAIYKDKIYQKFNSQKQLNIFRQVYPKDALQMAAKLLSDDEKIKLKELLTT